MNKKILISFIATFLISGCSDSNIDQVKEWRIEGATNYKIGQVFDNYEFCDDTEWSSSDGNSGNSIVEFTCFFTTSDETIGAVKTRIEKAIKTISDDITNLESKDPEMVVKYTHHLEEAKKGLSQANTSGDERSIKHYKQLVENESSGLKRQKSYHQKRIDGKKEVVVKYQQVLSNLDTFEEGRIYFEYNLINETVSLKDAKVYFDGNHAQLGWSDYGALAKGHIAGKDMVAAWEKASKLYINAIVKQLVQ
jgi:hypothetical protein